MNIQGWSHSYLVMLMCFVVCELETVNSKYFKTFYPIDRFITKQGVIEFLVRFKGVADGHISLTENITETIPRNCTFFQGTKGFVLRDRR